MNYSNYESVNECAADIARECVLKGESKGWCGSLEDLKELEKILTLFNIVYVDDICGTWAVKK